MVGRAGFEFSFSGLKTAVAQRVSQAMALTEQEVADLCASFQAVVTESLVERALYACRKRNVPRLLITGGVAANRGLRALAAERAPQQGVSLHLPPFHTCTDNAAMIAYAGACKLKEGRHDDLHLDIFSRSPILGAPTASENKRLYRSQRLPRPKRTTSS